MGTSRKLRPLVVSAAVATLLLTTFAAVPIVGARAQSGFDLFTLVWPIALKCAVAVSLVMALLYRALADLLRRVEEREAIAKHMALHDQLTGLANRALLEDRLGHALARYRRKEEKVAFLILDLDRFKQVNDTLGHHAGDLLVRQVGARLTALLRESDTVARIGGDEFAIIQSNPRGEEDVRLLCDRVIRRLSEPFDLDGRVAHVGASVGAVLATGDTVNAPELMRRADITMYRAKSSGRNCYRIFSDEMDLAVRRREQIESGLRKALDLGAGIALHFQPQINSRGIVTGVEGLLRWFDPQLGEVEPSEIIPIAEECGLIRPLGEFVFRSACAAAARWPHLSIAINLSPLQFRIEDLPARLRDIAGEQGVDCSQLELEITESLLIEHGEFCAGAVAELRDYGFRIAFDDFGTGYSSLSYLRRFQVDKIKLHRSFIDSAHIDQSIAIIRAAVTLGHAMNLEVVAEGISTPEQEQVALEAGCDSLQGDRYAAAMAPESLDEFLNSRSAGFAFAA